MHIQETVTERSLTNIMGHGKGLIKAFLEYCPNSSRETMMKINQVHQDKKRKRTERKISGNFKYILLFKKKQVSEL